MQSVLHFFSAKASFILFFFNLYTFFTSDNKVFADKQTTKP